MKLFLGLVRAPFSRFWLFFFLYWNDITYIIGRLDVHQEAKEGRDVHLSLQVGQGPAAPVLEVVLGLLLPVVPGVLVSPLLVLGVVVVVHVVTPRHLLLHLMRLVRYHGIPEPSRGHHSSGGGGGAIGGAPGIYTTGTASLITAMR